MKKIDNISSIEGRIILKEIFHKLRFERQRNSFSVLFTLWKICVSEVEINQYIDNDVTIMYKLGVFNGTLLWLEEVVNRYYFSVLNSFTYFGAAVLLVLIGINRFTDKVDNSTVIYGLAFEAMMLIFIFIVMLFSPSEDILEYAKSEEQNDQLEKELLNEIGEISRDFAVTSTQLDKITDHLLSVIDRQNELTKILLDISKTNSDVVNPNPKMIEIMTATNIALSDFNKSIIELNQTTSKLKQEEIQIIVRKEIDNFFTNRISNQ